MREPSWVRDDITKRVLQLQRKSDTQSELQGMEKLGNEPLGNTTAKILPPESGEQCKTRPEIREPLS